MTSIALALILTVVGIDTNASSFTVINVHTVRQFHKTEARCHAELARLMTDMPPGVMWGGYRPHFNTDEMHLCVRGNHTPYKLPK